MRFPLDLLAVTFSLKCIGWKTTNVQLQDKATHGKTGYKNLADQIHSYDLVL